MAKAIDYLAAAIVDELRAIHPKTVFTSLADIITFFRDKFGIDVEEAAAGEAAMRIAQLGLAKAYNDPYAGFIFSPDSNLTILINIGKIDNEQNADFLRALAGKEPLLSKVFANSNFWKDLRNQSSQNDDAMIADATNAAIPASDRIVTLSHNQYQAIEPETTKLIEQIENGNGVPDEPGFRERVLGHIRAGRELLRVGTFDAQLFYMSMIVGLKMLVEKYGDHALGALASKLLDVIVASIGDISF